MGPGPWAVLGGGSEVIEKVIDQQLPPRPSSSLLVLKLPVYVLEINLVLPFAN